MFHERRSRSGAKKVAATAHPVGYVKAPAADPKIYRPGYKQLS